MTTARQEKPSVPTPDAAEVAPTLHTVTIQLCSLCIDGSGGECHTPGCALWLNRAPDLSLRNHPMVTMIDGKPSPAYLNPPAPKCGACGTEIPGWETHTYWCPAGGYATCFPSSKDMP